VGLKKYLDNTLIFFTLTVFFQAIITFLLTQMSNPPSAVQSQFAFSAEAFSKIVNEWNNLDRSIFLTHYLFDFIYPLIYGRFFYLALNKKSKMPVVATVCDLTENIFHFLMIGQYIPIHTLATAVAAVCASIKWALLVVCALIVIVTYLRPRLKKLYNG
jgi:hypothetical protein